MKASKSLLYKIPAWRSSVQARAVGRKHRPAGSDRSLSSRISCSLSSSTCCRMLWYSRSFSSSCSSNLVASHAFSWCNSSHPKKIKKNKPRMRFTCWSPASSCPAPCWRSAARCGTRARRWSSACWPRTWPRCRRERWRGARGSGGWSSCPARRRRRRPALPGRSPRPGWSEAAALGVHRRLMLLLQGFSGGSPITMTNDQSITTMLLKKTLKKKTLKKKKKIKILQPHLYYSFLTGKQERQSAFFFFFTRK